MIFLADWFQLMLLGRVLVGRVIGVFLGIVVSFASLGDTVLPINGDNCVIIGRNTISTATPQAACDSLYPSVADVYLISNTSISCNYSA